MHDGSGPRFVVIRLRRLTQAESCKCHVSFIRNDDPGKNGDIDGRLPSGAQGATLGRSPLLSSQTGSIRRSTCSAHRASSVPMRWPSPTRPRRRRWGWLVGMTSAGKRATSSSSRRTMTRSIRRRTKLQGRGQGRLQSQAQGRPDDDLGAVATTALSRPFPVRPVPAAHWRRRVPAPCGADLADDRPRQADVPDCAPVLPQGRADRAGLERPRSSPIRSTTSSSTTRRRSTSCAAGCSTTMTPKPHG